MEPKFSLCIPTMNRFDTFLDNYLEIYLQFKKEGIIDEIVICDETGEDYEKILHKYNDGNPNEPIRLYKNETVLGTYENKRNVILKSKPGNFIALIDSDNFAGNNYFEIAKTYIVDNNITPDMPVCLCPIISEPHFEFSYFNNFIIDGAVTYHYLVYGTTIFQPFLNTGNFVTTRVADEIIKYEKSEIIETMDCIQKHLWSFQQIPNYRIHGVTNLRYLHNVHDDSICIKNKESDEIFKKRLNDMTNAFKAFI